MVKNKEEANFYTGAVFMFFAVLSVSFLPIALKKLDLNFYFTFAEFQNIAVAFTIFGTFFWLFAGAFFKQQLLFCAILIVLFYAAVYCNSIAIYP